MNDRAWAFVLGLSATVGCAFALRAGKSCFVKGCDPGLVCVVDDQGELGKCVPTPPPTTTLPSPPPPTPTPSPVSTPTPTPIPSPTPTPGGACPMPDRCPALKIWRGGLHNCQFPNHTPSKKPDGSPEPVANGTCIVDTTPGFVGGPRGLPCNEEHNAVCSCTGTDQPAEATTWRRCEDPRGPEFTVTGSGVRSWRVSENPFQLTVKHNGGGSVHVRICPRRPLKDHYGAEVQVQGDACRDVEWSF